MKYFIDTEFVETVGHIELISIGIVAEDGREYYAVHTEADLKDASGKAVHVVADGKLEDLGNYHRTIEGTWRQGGATGNFKLTRD